MSDRMLVTLPAQRCLDLLGTRPVGRLVFTQRALPQVLPVNFRVADGIVLRVTADSTAAAACRGTVVAFEVDDIDPDARSGWSVTVVGRADEVTDPAELAALRRLPLESWLGDSRDHVIRIAFDQVTGREIVPVSVPAAS